jgi:stage II sporulation protein D
MVQINSFQRGTTNRFFPRYRGRFELTVVDEDSFLAINEVDLEEYLYQVVPSEMVISWPMEALKAQAVASRTYAVAQVIYSRQGHLGFHVSDSTNSQVYNNQPEAASATRAIQETAEQILAKEDDTIGSTYFYSTSPRRVMDSKQAWNDLSELYLEGKSPWYRWQCYFSAEELAELFMSNTDIPPGEVLAVEVGERDELGRVVVLTVKTSGGTGTIVGELNIRRALKPKRLQRINDTVTGLSLLPSAMFFVESKRDGAGKLLGVTLFGGGSGHGLGMAQWGAKGMAEAGSDYLTILRTYYPEMQLFTHSDQLRY